MARLIAGYEYDIFISYLNRGELKVYDAMQGMFNAKRPCYFSFNFNVPYTY
jgi:hypothetical protein